MSLQRCEHPYTLLANILLVSKDLEPFVVLLKSIEVGLQLLHSFFIRSLLLPRLLQLSFEVRQHLTLFLDSFHTTVHELDLNTNFLDMLVFRFECTNESLHLAEFERVCRAEAFLLERLGRMTV